MRHHSSAPDGLVEAYQQGASITSLAVLHKRSRNLVSRWLHSAGVTRRSAKEQKIIEIGRLSPSERDARVRPAREVRARNVAQRLAARERRAFEESLAEAQPS